MIGNGDCFSQTFSNTRIMKSHLLSQICIVTDLLSEVVYMSYKILLLAVGSRDLSQAEKFFLLFFTSCANSQNDNYFHSKRQPGTILSENNCHFVTLLSFASSSFFLSLRKITWLNSQQPKTRGYALQIYCL